MLGGVERFVAWRYLRPTRGEGFISVIAGFALIGIALGVGTLIVVLAVMGGFREELLSRVLGVNGHASVVSGPEGIADFDRIAQSLREAKGVTAVTPYIEGQVLLSANGVSSGSIVRGVRAEDLEHRPIFADNVQQGALGSLGQEDRAAVGSHLAERLGLGIGSEFTILTPKGVATAFGTVPRIKTFKVGAIFEVGMYEYDSGFVYVPLADAQAYFQLPDRVNAIEVTVDDPENIGRYRSELQSRLGSSDARLVDWQQLNSHFFNALQVERNVMFLILTLIILVAAFNIITGITMLVKSKGRDIAILRTMGATRGTILRIFFLSGASIGVAGTLIGFVLGLLFALNIDVIRKLLERTTGAELWSPEIRFLSELPARVEPSDVLSVVGMGLALSFLATVYPAWRAARLDPVEALRYE